MEKDILKLLPQKAFKLISFKETLRISALVTQSLIDKKNYLKHFELRKNQWKIESVQMVEQLPNQKSNQLTPLDGESILKIYFAQFYDRVSLVHLDLRKNYFFRGDTLLWQPSKLHYSFSPTFLEGVRTLYEGFYFDEEEKFQRGLLLLGILRESMSGDQKKAVSKIFFTHFGEGRVAPVKLSLQKLQESFNTIFSFFIKEDIPLNPEFAVLGALLVTLYTTLQEIDAELNVREAFLSIYHHYKQLN